jgi:CRISPR/Cas system-associated exonuclease Cas4 (RecB family)
MVRIIDYKTGSVQARELNLKSWDKLTGEPEMAKAFQLLLYAWLYYKKDDNRGENIQSGHFTLRKISSGFMKVKLPEGKEIDHESMDIFEEILVKLLEEILDPATPFVQAEDEVNCRNCPFTAICTR